MRLFILFLIVFASNSAFAHTGASIDIGFESGFWHPILGWDHFR